MKTVLPPRIEVRKKTATTGKTWRGSQKSLENWVTSDDASAHRPDGRLRAVVHVELT